MLTENQKVGGMIHSHIDPGNLNLGDHVVVERTGDQKCDQGNEQACREVRMCVSSVM
jgi:hypothetical protein